MLFRIFILLATLGRGSISAADAFAISADVVEVARDEGDLEAAPIVAVTGWYESAWTPLLGDSGRSAGELQIGEVVRDGHSIAEVLRDRRLGIRLWIRALHRLDKVCGSRPSAIGALATGKCGGAPKLVAFRLHESSQ